MYGWVILLRGEIYHFSHFCQRCKFLHFHYFFVFFLLKLLKLGEIDGVKFWLGDILSQGQIVPLHYAPPRRHIVPTDAPSPVTFCPTFSI